MPIKLMMSFSQSNKGMYYKEQNSYSPHHLHLPFHTKYGVNVV